MKGCGRGYGGEVGRTLLELYGTCCPVQVRAAAAAAAGSDARMNGCPMPVVINSGSGNQGITLTLPVVEYAKELHASSEMLLRALVLANLLSVHQKKYIGSLSAYCGATSAAVQLGAAVCWMRGGGYEEICGTITNTLATLGGMLCDGGKILLRGKNCHSRTDGASGGGHERERPPFPPRRRHRHTERGRNHCRHRLYRPRGHALCRQRNTSPDAGA